MIPLQPQTLPTIGTALAVSGTIISVCGVAANNILLDHISAMLIWRFSNIIFVGFFYGQWKGYWNGGVSSFVMMILNSVFSITNEVGLWKLGL